MAKKEKKPLTEQQLINRKKRYEFFSTSLLTFMSLCYPLVGFIALFLFRNDENILKRRLIDGICYEPLAEEFDLSVGQVKNIVYKTQTKLFKHIGD